MRSQPTVCASTCRMLRFFTVRFHLYGGVFVANATTERTGAARVYDIVDLVRLRLFSTLALLQNSAARITVFVWLLSEYVHALEGLACRKCVAPASSPAAHASRVRRSRRLYSMLAAALGLLAHALVTKQ